MPVATSQWYYVGPDKTGFDCPDCCAAFSYSYGSCFVASCSVSLGQARRNYVCPTEAFPSPFHYYYIQPGTNNVSVSANPVLCPGGVQESCGYFEPPLNTLNSGGRIGAGCSQEYVTWIDGPCSPYTQDCPGTCNENCGIYMTGNVTFLNSCYASGGVCGCNNAGSINNCACECLAPIWGALCCDPDPEASGECACGSDSGGGDNNNCTSCDDGTQACPGPCLCAGSPVPECGYCETVSCNGTNYVCDTPSCSEGCDAGFTCVCGGCVCTTSDTCCSGDRYGFSFVPYGPPNYGGECISCGDGYPTYAGKGCCLGYERKGCEVGEKCCADGRCYPSETTLCLPD